MKFKLAIMILTGALCLASCGGGQSNENTTAQVINANSANNASVVPIVPVNGQGNVNGTFPTNENVTVVNPSAANVKLLTYPGPDDSEYAATMDKSGVAIETRTFRSDKYISKVVRTTRDPQNTTTAIYLRSGKVVTLAGDKWPDIRSQPLSVIYEAAGIKAPPAQLQPKAPVNGTVKTKPSE